MSILYLHKLLGMYTVSMWTRKGERTEAFLKEPADSQTIRVEIRERHEPNDNIHRIFRLYHRNLKHFQIAAGIASGSTY
jgi:hypothetical protein